MHEPDQDDHDGAVDVVSDKKDDDVGKGHKHHMPWQWQAGTFWMATVDLHLTSWDSWSETVDRPDNRDRPRDGGRASALDKDGRQRRRISSYRNKWNVGVGSVQRRHYLLKSWNTNFVITCMTVWLDLRKNAHPLRC